MPAVLPLGVLSVFLAFSRHARGRLARDFAGLGMFWVSVALTAVYYLINLFNPIAVRGTCELLVHTGTLGAILAVPVYAAAKAASERLVPVLAVLCLFVTLPLLVLQPQKTFLYRLSDILRQEMSDTFIPQPARQMLRCLSPGLKDRMGIYIGTGRPDLDRRAFEPLRAYYRVLGKYAYAREREGKALVRGYLQRNPEIFNFLLAVKPGRSIEMITVRFLSDTESIARELLKKTGDETYRLIIRAARLERERVLAPSERTLAAVLVWLDYQRHPGTPRPPDGMEELAEKTLDRLKASLGE